MSVLDVPPAAPNDASKGRPAKRDYPTAIGLATVHLGALLAFVPAFFSWWGVAVGLLFFWLCGGVGITLGSHRLLTHRRLVVPRVVEYGGATRGALALQGGPIEWVATHQQASRPFR